MAIKLYRSHDLVRKASLEHLCKDLIIGLWNQRNKHENLVEIIDAFEGKSGDIALIMPQFDGK